MWMEELPNGKFTYRERYKDLYTEKYKKVSVTLSSKSNQAKNKAQKKLNEKIEKTLNAEKKSDHTVEELLQEWWSFKRQTVRNNTRRNYGNILKALEKSAEIKLEAKIAKVDAQYFQKYFNTLNFSHSQNQKYRSVLKMAFDYAVNMEYLSDNPIDKTKIPKPPVTLENYIRVEDLYLENDEIDRLLEQYYSSYQSIRTGQLIEFMYLTGTRVGEAISLKVCDYHKDKELLDIHGTLDYSNGYKTAEKGMTKTNASYREIGISNRAMEILDQIIFENQLKIDDYNNDSYIFLGRTGLPIQVNTLNNSLKYNNDKLGKNKINKRLHSHIFRHSHISLLSEIGVPLKAIMHRVGHEDESTTLNIYTHVTKKQKADIVKKMNSLGF
ncbi:site-specific integrase [Tetragenococcus koreensis]|uniref:tyrosine-type recombinase/integrase n=1 Tax=Tetragenococcus koreensis TaxID=290335 RepID=UPI001F3974B5|nr:site-specific integrase [Tetragenococcus koreensis]MCF1585193.1 site-specific integrase [Tetragenococcus koreensis]MCF1628831.1 site-specific integrase [Tetragenococcus koreensis]